MDQWLNQADFLEVIQPVFPASFQHIRLLPYLNEIRDTWLTDLLTREQLTPEGNLAFPAVANFAAREKAVAKFLAYATLSRYVLRGNVTFTNSGLVQKDFDDGEPISDSQRSQLSRDYQGLAEHYARQLGGLFTTGGECGVGRTGSGRSSFRTVRPNRRSRFD